MTDQPTPARIPLIPTTLVALAVLVMIGLGIWQLQRRAEKEQALALMANNANLPAIAFPKLGADLDHYRFRRSSLVCLDTQFVEMVAGKARNGRTGYRAIMACRTGAEGPGAYVDIGVSPSPSLPEWQGGAVRGVITLKPTSQSIWNRMTGGAVVDEPLLIADAPAQGRLATSPPNIADIPNNHLAYAVQWFLFAGVAIIIYILALRRRNASKPA
ncbi:SURF1 family protein [Sphingobium sp. CAP-1]|uniref:SURF1 family protein n=1 Tax=Sphingobium sp. CAP-1 TaxID=2676077 RepID=UPI0012BB2450|nr:SURF1 family protein [Sphingobium sp. CAP-1]QGP79322.1 SURF1 family protein [Sphingobium sp. CAP-1]